MNITSIDIISNLVSQGENFSSNLVQRNFHFEKSKPGKALKLSTRVSQLRVIPQKYRIYFPSMEIIPFLAMAVVVMVWTVA